MIENPKIHRVPFTNPEAFEAAIEPVAGRVFTRPARGTLLRGAVRVARLPKIGFLAIDSDPMATRMEAASGFFGLTITRGAPFKIANGRHIRTYQRNSAHLLLPDSPFDFRNSEQTSVLGTNFFLDDLPEHASRLKGGVDNFQVPDDFRLSLATPAGASLARYLTFVWSELCQGGGVLNSELAAREIEDGLIAALVWAMDASQADMKVGQSGRPDGRIAQVEEYLLAHLCEPVSRTALAQLAGVSVRTLSRAFLKRHGMGPMAFLRRQRLEAARREILLAEPGETTISEIALRYGFAQPSKFTLAYKAEFGEKPSDTLCRG